MEEQRLLFSELAGHLARMALFKVNTGTREHEVCGLRWEWEVQVPELETSVFIIPADHVKNGAERYVVLNRTAKSVIEACRDEHKDFVFTKEARDGQRHPQSRMNNSGWKAARERAAERYPEEFGRPCPQGFRRIRVHDLKHTFGYRLRAAGVSFEDRKTLLGHKASHVTTHYSAADIETLISLAEKVCELASRKSPALSIVRAGGASQVPEIIGGKGGTRTLDPGIMSAFLGSEVFDFTTFGQTAVAAKCLKVHRRAGENPADLPRARMYCGEQTSRPCDPARPSFSRWNARSAFTLSVAGRIVHVE